MNQIITYGGDPLDFGTKFGQTLQTKFEATKKQNRKTRKALIDKMETPDTFTLPEFLANEELP